VLQCVTVCCSVLQCVALCCSVLRCVALFCVVLNFDSVSSPPHTHITPTHTHHCRFWLSFSLRLSSCKCANKFQKSPKHLQKRPTSPEREPHNPSKIKLHKKTHICPHRKIPLSSLLLLFSCKCANKFHDKQCKRALYILTESPICPPKKKEPYTSA